MPLIPSVIFGFSNSPAAITKSSGVTKLGEVHPAGYMLLLESEELGGDGASLGISIFHQKNFPVGVFLRAYLMEGSALFHSQIIRWVTSSLAMLS